LNNKLTLTTRKCYLVDTPNWSVRTVETVIATCQPFQVWHYETGCILKAIERVWLKTGKTQCLDFIKQSVDPMIQPDGRIKGYAIEEYNLDQINTGRALFFLYQQTQEAKYLEALKLLRLQMKGHPRTSDGGFWHKKVYPYQMWLDGLWMASPFLAEYGKAFNEPALYDEVAEQTLLMERHTRDPISGLLYHAYDESKTQKWANPSTGCSPHFWSRAMGWFSMAVIDILDYLPVDHPKRGEIIGIFRRAMSAVSEVQDRETGLWYQVLDQGNRAGNYLEASGSAMFTYAMFKGGRLKYLENEFINVAEKAFNGMIEHFIKIDAQGRVQLGNICSVAGLGGKPYRDGSYEYYVSEKVVTNDPKGLTPFIMASIEREKLQEIAKLKK
jgi:unsaturated rhamnogalacturonyl hydrolase